MDVESLNRFQESIELSLCTAPPSFLTFDSGSTGPRTSGIILPAWCLCTADHILNLNVICHLLHVWQRDLDCTHTANLWHLFTYVSPSSALLTRRRLPQRLVLFRPLHRMSRSVLQTGNEPCKNG